jgi:hypothetical protein
MGLLDAFNSPEMALAAGLLGGGSFGQALGRGMAGSQAVQLAEQRRMEMEAQAEERRAMAEHRQQQTALAQAKFKMQQDALAGVWQRGGQGSPMDAPMSQGGPFMSQGGPSMGGGSQGSGDMSAQLDRLERMAIAGVPGAKEALEIFKFRNTPQQLQAGTFSQNPVTGAREYIPKVETGLTFGPNGIVRLPGSENIAGMAGELENAKRQAENRNTLAPLDRLDSKTMRPFSGTVDDLINPRRAASSGEQQLRGEIAGGNGNTAADYAREIRQTQASLQNPNLDPASRKMLEQHLAVTMADAQRVVAQAPQQGGFAGPADIAKAVEQAKADIVSTPKSASTLKSARYMDDLLTKALEHPGRESATGLSGLINPANYIPGTSAKDYSVLHDQLQGNVFLQAYETLKGGGVITDLEGKKAEAAIARMSRSQSDGEYKKALEEFRDIVRDNIDRMTGGATKPAETKPKQNNGWSIQRVD